MLEVRYCVARFDILCCVEVWWDAVLCEAVSSDVVRCVISCEVEL